VDVPEGRRVEKLLGCDEVLIDEEKKPKNEAAVEGEGKSESCEEIIFKFAERRLIDCGHVGVADELVDEGDEEVKKLNKLKKILGKN
jgi:hypothetical protein